MWGATIDLVAYADDLQISIHAPRVGSDGRKRSVGFVVVNFNPRSPCGERQSRPSVVYICTIFQSTLPVWGATMLAHRQAARQINFNPRSPCGERRKRCGLQSNVRLFQSTLPVWGATIPMSNLNTEERISIHAPRVGSDEIHSAGCAGVSAISIHAPRVGSDKNELWRLSMPTIFQSTLPVWGATFFVSRHDKKKAAFQSTLPVWGATYPQGIIKAMRQFQSTLPVWGATDIGDAERIEINISIHAPRVGSDHSLTSKNCRV